MRAMLAVAWAERRHVGCCNPQPPRISCGGGWRARALSTLSFSTIPSRETQKMKQGGGLVRG
eukprot:7005923-Pyramimonas_sp.AAC.1